jgi:hypothetical protein
MGVMLFNGFGYRMVSNYFDQKASDRLVEIIDQNQFNETELISVKTPINLPYYANNPKFERVDGEMVINGIVYQYVQRRVYNDSVEIRVLPNQDRLHIKNAREDFYKLAADLDQKGMDKKSAPMNKSTTKFINFDYFAQDIKWSLKSLAPLKITIGSNYAVGLLSICLPVQMPPPKFNA